MLNKRQRALSGRLQNRRMPGHGGLRAELAVSSAIAYCVQTSDNIASVRALVVLFGVQGVRGSNVGCENCEFRSGVGSPRPRTRGSSQRAEAELAVARVRENASLWRC